MHAPQFSLCNELDIIVKCIEVCEEPGISAKRNFFIAMKFWVMVADQKM